MLLIYSVLCLGLQLIFWMVKNVVADAVAVSCMGFLLGPYFATVSLYTNRHAMLVVTCRRSNMCDTSDRV
jgi:hypothetical protein